MARLIFKIEKHAREALLLPSRQTPRFRSNRSRLSWIPAVRKALSAGWSPFGSFNGLSITAAPSVVQELVARPDVAQISGDAIEVSPAASPEANLSSVNAPALWSMGYYGQGVVVANLDTGVSLDNPDLAARWRGGSNSWYDPYGQHPFSPTDLTGHGTATMGVILAGDASGSSIGVAPLAQWIAARIFNDQDGSTKTAIHQAFQWVLDPDGNSGHTRCSTGGE